MSDTLNLNDFVWVRLTDKGRALLREQDARWSQLFASSYGWLATADKQAAENDGWSKWQLWSLIQAFGPALYLGCDPPFETTIRLTTPPTDRDADPLWRCAECGASNSKSHAPECQIGSGTDSTQAKHAFTTRRSAAP